MSDPTSERARNGSSDFKDALSSAERTPSEVPPSARQQVQQTPQHRSVHFRELSGDCGLYTALYTAGLPECCGQFGG